MDYWRDESPSGWQYAYGKPQNLDSLHQTRYYLEDNKLLRALVTSPRRKERSDIETGPFVDSRLHFEKERILSRGNEFDRIDSRFKLDTFVRARFIYERDSMLSQRVREIAPQHAQLNKWNVNIWFITPAKIPIFCVSRKRN